MEIRKCEWDTENFGFNIGKCNLTNLTPTLLNDIITTARFNNYKLIYIESIHKNPIFNNILFCDERRIYQKKRKNKTNISFHTISQYTISQYNKLDISDILLELALECGRFSRFHLDPNFPKSCFKILYKKWIENSLNKKIATNILTYNENTKPIGLLSYKNEDNKSTIGLFSVLKNVQNQGIGLRLFQFYENSLSNSIENLEVITQGVNKTACSFYEKNGYLLTSTSYIYHLWI